VKPLALVLFAFLLLTSHFGFAGSATWNLNPTSNDWNTAANWTPATVPNDPADIATFDVSSVTTISLEYVDLSGIIFNPGASAFTIVGSLGIDFYGAGITNNSGGGADPGRCFGSVLGDKFS